MLKSKATPTPRKTIKIHVKILTEPEGPDLRERFSAMRRVYDTAGIDVIHASTETLSGVETLNDLDIGGVGGSVKKACDGRTTEEQDRLAEFRDGVPEDEIVVYVCRILTNGNAGCANHPQDKPMAVVSAGSSLYTMAHEVAHVLGIHGHPPPNKTRLMNKGGTDSTTENDPLPVLTIGEIKIMRNSPLLK